MSRKVTFFAARPARPVNVYCLFKGRVLRAAPYKSEYVGSPHYIIATTYPDGTPFNIVINSASTQVGGDGNNDVYFDAEPGFPGPLTVALSSLKAGLHTDGFPTLDYVHPTDLFDLRRLKPVPYRDQNGDRADVNDIIDKALTVDEGSQSQSLPYDNGSGQVHTRDFWTPQDANVTVYGFGFVFAPKNDGLHETHLNQGNPKDGGHAKENGPSHDGAVIIERGGVFTALFTAFQTQWLPTDAAGNPAPGATALPDYIKTLGDPE